MRRLLCILLCVMLLSAPTFAAEESVVESLLIEFMQTNDLDETNFAISYFNTSTGEAYRFNDTAFLPVGKTWTLPLHMYYYEQEALGAFDPPADDPQAIFTIDGMTLEDCRYESIVNRQEVVAVKMRNRIGSFRQYQLLVNESFGHCAEASLPDVFFENTNYSTEFLINCLKDILRQPETYEDLLANYSLVQSAKGIARLEQNYTLVHFYHAQDGWICDFGEVYASQPYLISCFIAADKGDALLGELSTLLCEYAEESSKTAEVVQSNRENGRDPQDYTPLDNSAMHRERMLSWVKTALIVFAGLVVVVSIVIWIIKRRSEP